MYKVKYIKVRCYIYNILYIRGTGTGILYILICYIIYNILYCILYILILICYIQYVKVPYIPYMYSNIPYEYDSTRIYLYIIIRYNNLN